MRDYISIGSAPCEEACVQVNPEGDYHQAMRAECLRFLELVSKKLGPEPEGASLAIKSNPHDFGTYYEVVCYFEDSNEEAREYALLCEGEAPLTWGDDTLSPEKKAAHEKRREARREELAEEAAECNS